MGLCPGARSSSSPSYRWEVPLEGLEFRFWGVTGNPRGGHSEG